MEKNKDQDRHLFRQVAIDVREHPNRYSRAGKWLDKYCGEKRQVSQLVRFNEARQDLLKKYKEQDFIPEDDARCFILITWLLTDADAQKTNPNITQFARWPWKPTSDNSIDSRCMASSLWRQNNHVYGPWMRLAHIAWTTLETQKQCQPDTTETEQNIAPAKLQRIWIWLKVFIKESYRLAMRSFFDSAMHK